jgi:hypothetical protein
MKIQPCEFHDMFVQRDPNLFCFTICLFISPDLDGHRAPKMKYCPTETHKRSLFWYLFHVSPVTESNGVMMRRAYDLALEAVCRVKEESDEGGSRRNHLGFTGRQMSLFQSICGGQASPTRDEYVSVDDVVYGPQSSVSSYSLCFRQLAQLRCLAVLGTGNCNLITR